MKKYNSWQHLIIILFSITFHNCESRTIIKDDLIGFWLLKSDRTSGILIDQFDNGKLYQTSFSDYDSVSKTFTPESSGCFIDIISTKNKQVLEYICLSGTNTASVFMHIKNDLQIRESKYTKD